MLRLKWKSLVSVLSHNSEHFTEHPETMLQHHPVFWGRRALLAKWSQPSWARTSVPHNQHSQHNLYVLWLWPFAQPTDVKHLKNRFKGHHRLEAWMKSFSSPGYTRVLWLVCRVLCSFKMINVYSCILLLEFVVAVKCRKTIQTIFRKLTFISNFFLLILHSNWKQFTR